jgi:hypothetical protein
MGCGQPQMLVVSFLAVINEQQLSVAAVRIMGTP